MLRDRAVAFDRIVRIHTDSILYLREGKPTTAWLDRRPGGGFDVRVETGWPAQPAATLLIRPDIADIVAPFDHQTGQA